MTLPWLLGVEWIEGRFAEEAFVGGNGNEDGLGGSDAVWVVGYARRRRGRSQYARERSHGAGGEQGRERRKLSLLHSDNVLELGVRAMDHQ